MKIFRLSITSLSKLLITAKCSKIEQKARMEDFKELGKGLLESFEKGFRGFKTPRKAFILKAFKKAFILESSCTPCRTCKSSVHSPSKAKGLYQGWIFAFKEKAKSLLTSTSPSTLPPHHLNFPLSNKELLY